MAPRTKIPTNGNSPPPSSQRQDSVKVSLFEEIGASGLKRFSGYVSGDDAYLPNLGFWQSVQVFSDMVNNEPVVGAAMFAIDNLIRQVDWTVEPFSSSAADTDAAEFLDQNMHDMSNSFTDFISEALTMLPFGWAWHEVVYKRRNGMVDDDAAIAAGDNSKFNDSKVGWRKIALRSQETLLRWEFDDNGGIQGMWQLSPPDYKLVLIPISRSLLFRTTARKNDPQGRSILRSAYRPYFFKRRIEEIEGVGIERDLAGLPLLMVDPTIMDPENATIAQKKTYNEMKLLIQSVRRDTAEGIILPSIFDEGGRPLYEFKLLSAGGNRQFDINAVIQRKAEEIAMSMLTDFIMLGQTGVGSYALSQDKTTLFSDAIGTYCDVFTQTLNNYAVPRLFKLNGMSLLRLPKIRHGDIKAPDLMTLGTFIVAAAQGGLLIPDDKLLDWIRVQMTAPERDKNAPITPPQVPMGGPPSPAQAGTPPANGNQPPKAISRSASKAKPAPRIPRTVATKKTPPRVSSKKYAAAARSR